MGVAWADGSVSIQHNQMSQIPAVGENGFTAEFAENTERKNSLNIGDAIDCGSSDEKRRNGFLCGLCDLRGKCFSGSMTRGSP